MSLIALIVDEFGEPKHKWIPNSVTRVAETPEDLRLPHHAYCKANHGRVAIPQSALLCLHVFLVHLAWLAGEDLRSGTVIS